MVGGPTSGTESRSYEIRDCHGKGQGMFASRDLFPGDLIVRENPMFVMPDKIYQLEDMRDVEDWIDRRINLLNSEEREIFFNLSDCRTSGEEENVKTAMGIFFTNDMSYGDDAALFPAIAKSNHSCVPNADFIPRLKLGVMDLVTVRHIKKGEEITLSYMPSKEEGSELRDVRRDYLRHWYGFNCVCTTCLLQGDTLKEDEATRKRVKEAQNLGLDKIPIEKMSEFLLDLSRINSKLPYQLEVSEMLFQRSFEIFNAAYINFEERRLLSAQIVAWALLVDSIIGEEETDGDTDIWTSMLALQYFSI